MGMPMEAGGMSSLSEMMSGTGLESDARTVGKVIAAGYGPQAGQPAGAPLDLVSLATTYVDAVGELNLFKVQLDRLRRLQADKVVSSQELAITEVKVKTAQRKVELLRRIAASATSATEAQLAVTQKQWESFRERSTDQVAIAARAAQMAQVKSRLEILKMILDSD